MRWDITSEGVLVYCELDNNTTELTIPEGVKVIRKRVFQYFLKLKTVIIPEGVTSIQEKAFYNCASLSCFSIPKSVTHIGMEAFEGTAWLNNYPDDYVIINHILIKYHGVCQNMPKELHIPEGVHVINRNVFNFSFWDKRTKKIASPSMKKVILPEGLKVIGEGAFAGCQNLEEIQFPESIELLYPNSFQRCRKLKRIPLLVHEGKVFYRFPEFYGRMLCEKHMMQNHDYETDLLPEIKYDLIFQMFNLNIDPEGTGEYIHKHFPEMLPILIRLNDFALITKFPDLMHKHIDMLIQEAIRQKNHELQIMLTDYKYQHDLFGNKDWSL